MKLKSETLLKIYDILKSIYDVKVNLYRALFSLEVDDNHMRGMLETALSYAREVAGELGVENGELEWLLERALRDFEKGVRWSVLVDLTVAEYEIRKMLERLASTVAQVDVDSGITFVVKRFMGEEGA